MKNSFNILERQLMRERLGGKLASGHYLKFNKNSDFKASVIHVAV